MTISATDSVQTYAGDGSTVTFSYGYVFFDLDEVKVELQDDEGNITYPTKDGSGTYDYSVSGTFDTATSRYPNGGDVTLNTAPPSGYTVAVYREVEATQSTDYVENASFPAESHENALDRLTLLVQQVMDDTERSFKFPKTETADPAVPVPGANQYLRSNAAGDGVAWADEGPEAGALRDDIADGSARVLPWQYRQSATYVDADSFTTDTTTTDDAGEYVWHVGRRVRVYLGTSDAWREGVIVGNGTRGSSGRVDLQVDLGFSLLNEPLTVWVGSDGVNNVSLPSPIVTKSLTDLKAATGGNARYVLWRTTQGDGGGGMFYWRPGNHSSSVSNDPGEGVVVPPNLDTSGASGAWFREITSQDEISVLWWGATGGSNVTEINNAAYFVYNELGGGKLVFPAETTYTLSDSVNLYPNMTYSGQGWTTKFELEDGVSVDGAFDNAPAFQEDGLYNIAVEDFWIDCRSVGTLPNNKGIVFSSADNWRMTRIKCTNTVSYGLWVEETFVLTSPNFPESGRMEGCYVENSEEGIEIRECKDATVKDCVSVGGANTNHCFISYGPNTKNVTFVNCRAEGVATAAGFALTTGFDSISLINCEADMTSSANGIIVGTDAGSNGNCDSLYIIGGFYKAGGASTNGILATLINNMWIQSAKIQGATSGINMGADFPGTVYMTDTICIAVGSGAADAAVRNQATSTAAFVNMTGGAVQQINSGSDVVRGNVHMNGVKIDGEGGRILLSGPNSSVMNCYGLNATIILSDSGMMVCNNRLRKTDATTNIYGISGVGSAVDTCVINGNLLHNSSGSGDIRLRIASGAVDCTVVGNTVHLGTLTLDATANNVANNFSV